MDSISNIDSIQDHNGSKVMVTTNAIGNAIRQIASAMPTPRNLFAMFISSYRSNIYDKYWKRDDHRNTIWACLNEVAIRLVHTVQ